MPLDTCGVRPVLTSFASFLPSEGHGTDLTGLTVRPYLSDHELPAIISLVSRDLSEPYSIFTYRYFINNWPELCWVAYDGDRLVGVIVCKMDEKRKGEGLRGYIAMLAIETTHR
jgi:peptide alpha-N-acetyltransferase